METTAPFHCRPRANPFCPRQYGLHQVRWTEPYPAHKTLDESDPAGADQLVLHRVRMDVAKNRDVQLPVCALDKLLTLARSLDQTEAPLEQRLHIFDDDGSDQTDDVSCAERSRSV